MAETNFLGLPAAIGLTGNEYFAIAAPNGISSYTSQKALISLLVGFSAGTTPQTANTLYAGPTTTPSAAPAFRLMVSADLPATALAPNFYWNESLTALGL